MQGGGVTLKSAAGAPFGFEVRVEGAAPHAPERTIEVNGPGGVTLRRRLPDTQQNAWLDFYAEAAERFGTLLPISRRPAEPVTFEAPLRPLLTEAVSPDILYGYGDPSVLWAEGAWWLVVTSNDAPDAFPILRSEDMERWEHAGFVFPEGETPDWALTGENAADFWAPELHRVGSEYWLCFAAREKDRSLSIGMAKADRPQGPYTPQPEPLVRGGVIDAHLLFDRERAPWLVWKRDDNGVWPRLLSELLHARPELIVELFPEEAAQRTVSLLGALQPWARTLEPMEQFFIHQPLIEAAVEDFCAFGERVAAQRAVEPGTIDAVVNTLKTRVFAQRLAADGSAVMGERRLLLENDQPWEAHLIEGVWAVEHEGRCWLLYAANDFSTPHYGIGAAVADQPFGPYRKLEAPLLRSTAQWIGPGHPSVARGPDGRWRMFLHAFPPGEVGYKAFRALLTAEVVFEGDRILLR